MRTLAAHRFTLPSCYTPLSFSLPSPPHSCTSPSLSAFAFPFPSLSLSLSTSHTQAGRTSGAHRLSSFLRLAPVPPPPPSPPPSPSPPPPPAFFLHCLPCCPQRPDHMSGAQRLPPFSSCPPFSSLRPLHSSQFWDGSSKLFHLSSALVQMKHQVLGLSP